MGAIVDAQIELDKPVDVFAVEADRRMNYCDQCGISVSGRVYVAMPDGRELRFCYHHANKYRDDLEASGALLYDLSEG